MSDGSYTFVREHRVYAKTERGELTSSSHCRCLSLRAISSGVSPASLAEGRTTQTHYCCREASDAWTVFLPTPILFNHGKCVIRPFPTVCCLPVLPLYQSIIWLFCWCQSRAGRFVLWERVATECWQADTSWINCAPWKRPVRAPEQSLVLPVCVCGFFFSHQCLWRPSPAAAASDTRCCQSGSSSAAPCCLWLSAYPGSNCTGTNKESNLTSTHEIPPVIVYKGMKQSSRAERLGRNTLNHDKSLFYF